jgi:V/A-type H+-transporting ATPase subunit K
MEIIVGNGMFWAILGAAMAAFLAGTGSAIGVGICGEAAAGLISEEPEKFGQSLILQALPATQGIYGLLIAFIIMLKVGVIGTPVDITLNQGLYLFASAQPIAWAGFGSAIFQGRAAAAGVGTIAKRPEEFAKAMIYPAMVETFAILSLLISFLMINGLKI